MSAPSITTLAIVIFGFIALSALMATSAAMQERHRICDALAKANETTAWDLVCLNDDGGQ